MTRTIIADLKPEDRRRMYDATLDSMAVREGKPHDLSFREAREVFKTYFDLWQEFAVNYDLDEDENYNFDLTFGYIYIDED